MISTAFNAVLYQPLYNALVFLIGVIPTHDVGLAVIALTIVVRFILYPLSRRAIESQLAMKKVSPEVEAIKKKYKKNAPEASQEIFALYKARGIHPFSGFGLTLIQLPILIALYWAFARGGLPKIDAALLYPFVHVPAAVNMEFLGIINMSAAHNIVLALLVALSQFVYTRLSMGKGEKNSPVEASLSGDMAKSFEFQARYMMPGMFGVIAYFVAAAAPLYWLTGNVFMIAQEYFSGRRF
ncbi:MAG TPA: YidC/Oxa1 family membrane protein insertase [Candidatus Paceibacterota bacterium]|nr:YidC/Oxa1 family membrane protein insertase [Candidatus Paceibacterota bacterium]